MSNSKIRSRRRRRLEKRWERAERTGEAPPGTIWVCGACGKTSPLKRPTGMTRNYLGWDASCMLNAVLCYAGTLTSSSARGFNTLHGTVTGADTVEAYDSWQFQRRAVGRWRR